MVVQVIKGFKDVTEGKMRAVGDRFEVTAERFKALNGTKYGQLVREVKTRKPKTEE